MHALISKDGTKIAYDMRGQGPALIVVLGALNSRKTGAKLAKELMADFTVITYDRRGRGDSTDTLPYAPEREVDDLAALIDEVGAPVYLYGHSSGAALALQTSAEHPHKIKRLAIYEAPYTMTDDAAKSAQEYDKALKKALVDDNKDEAVTLFVRHVGVTDKQIEAMKRLPLWKGLVKLAPTLAYDSDVLGDDHALPTDLLSKVAVPALVMHGGKGAPSMRDAAEAMSRIIPNAEFLTIENQDHGVSPAALAPVLVRFFR